MNLELVDSTIYRANPTFKLVPADKLGTGSWLDDLPGDFYGMLLPKKVPGRAASERQIPVDTEQALLFLSLPKPGQLPFHIRRHLTDPRRSRIVKLVLDGLLEVETPDGFISGKKAAGILRARSGAASGTDRLSQKALIYGQRFAATATEEMLQPDPVDMVGARLYQYNTIAASPSWRRRLSTREGVDKYVGYSDSLVNPAVGGSSGWRFAPAEEMGWWHYWTARSSRRRMPFLATSGQDAPRQDCKLYISPVLEQMPEAFAASVKVLMDSPAHTFKVGATMAGLLRSDKMVAYFTDLDDMKETALRLQEQLVGITSHGVPFTADLTGDSLLSWGIDPPEDAPVEFGESESSQSWRGWITSQLAQALYFAAKADDPSLVPWEYALQRVRLDGIDTTTWIAEEHAWSQRELGSKESPVHLA